MNRVVAAEDMAAALAQCSGAKAVVWIYSPTFRRLAIRLSQWGSAAGVLLVMTGAQFFQGPLGWDVGDLEVEVEHDSLAPRWVRDRAAGVCVNCSSVMLVLFPPQEVPDHFNGWFEGPGDAPVPTWDASLPLFPGRSVASP